MNKKLNPDEVLMEYRGGMSPEDLALKFKVHPSTIRRYLRESGVKLGKISTPKGMDEHTKYELKKLLIKLDVPLQKVSDILTELDLRFKIDLKNILTNQIVEII